MLTLRSENDATPEQPLNWYGTAIAAMVRWAIVNEAGKPAP